jgi:DNA-binding NarL/FixJ family response regulator
MGCDNDPLGERDEAPPSSRSERRRRAQFFLGRLSVRERQVANLLTEGYTEVNVSARCGLTKSTVRTYVRRIYGKLGVYNRVELARKVLGVG